MWETRKTGLWITQNIKNPKQINLCHCRWISAWSQNFIFWYIFKQLFNASISLLLCLLNSLWHKSSSIILVNQNLKASFLFQVTLLDICTIHEEQAAVKTTGEHAFPQVLQKQALGVQTSAVPRWYEKDRSETAYRQRRCALWLLLPTTLKGPGNPVGQLFWTTSPLSGVQKPQQQWLPGHPWSPTQLQAASSSHKLQCLPSTFPQYSWRKRGYHLAASHLIPRQVSWRYPTLPCCQRSWGDWTSHLTHDPAQRVFHSHPSRAAASHHLGYYVRLIRCAQCSWAHRWRQSQLGQEDSSVGWLSSSSIPGGIVLTSFPSSTRASPLWPAPLGTIL